MLLIKTYYKIKYAKKKTTQKFREIRIKERRKGGFHKIYSNIKTRIYQVFIKNNINFNMSYEEIIGCSFEDLETYIINQLKKEMTIDNYGDWEIDHILPVSSFDFSNKVNIFKCFNYKNLQPLKKSENRKKFNKII